MIICDKCSKGGVDRAIAKVWVALFEAGQDVLAKTEKGKPPALSGPAFGSQVMDLCKECRVGILSKPNEPEVKDEPAVVDSK